MLAADIHDPGECECGRTKSFRHEACARCTAMDGAKAPEAAVIAALRSVGGWHTAAELALILQRHRETVWRLLDEMNRNGRVVRQWRETDATECTQRCRYSGVTRKAMRSNGGCWEYALGAVGK